jgi:hypothetical protein
MAIILCHSIFLYMLSNYRLQLIVNKAILLFGVNLPFGRESPTFIQNVTQLAKEGFDSPQNAKLFLQLDSIALNATSSRPGNVTLTARR